MSSYSQISYKTWERVRTTKIRDSGWLQGVTWHFVWTVTEICSTLKPISIWVDARERWLCFLFFVVLLIFTCLCCFFFNLFAWMRKRAVNKQINVVPHKSEGFATLLNTSENHYHSISPEGVYESCQAMPGPINHPVGDHIIALILSINTDNHKAD